MKIQSHLPALLLCAASANAADNIRIEYMPAETTHDKLAEQSIQSSDVNPIFVRLSQDYFPFRKPLTLIYGGEDGPMYDPDTHTIHIPYTFYLESLNYFSNNQYEDRYGKSPKTGALDTLLHTLLHEAGHAYIEDQSIPVLGKEEDAVDNFSTILLIDYLDDGADMAISAADMFAFESDDRPDYYDFGEYIDEHSFDLQRYFSTLCLVYGSDPEQYKSLLDEVEKDYLRDRKDFCQYNYENIRTNWQHYLQHNEPKEASTRKNSEKPSSSPNAMTN
ncbi:DUF4344 domain-containing metallopeptidase [Vibrio parahaemolyticus]|uniref:DUF4344 domain-containing metallopeptidase n=1 Tax=Vibrio parahaemolyticus TaxID=670 RepID=UPI001D71C664|nr:DUF4344 domain-containing metallopeptidase [Vibrio parahaemolyticus]EHY0995142.1 hypothetical protein [Vibrio parahaemolyticus]MCR9670925.1 DUF4344 domain-containing metallopeptidase [Vibrio parahaemolyticus]MCR9826525.1 DUF4344 domain-containing metallopeptidase [Vibrio parahaemolyticus]